MDLEREAFVSLCGEKKTQEAHCAYPKKPANPFGISGTLGRTTKRTKAY